MKRNLQNNQLTQNTIKQNLASQQTQSTLNDQQLPNKFAQKPKNFTNLDNSDDDLSDDQIIPKTLQPSQQNQIKIRMNQQMQHSQFKRSENNVSRINQQHGDILLNPASTLSQCMKTYQKLHSECLQFLNPQIHPAFSKYDFITQNNHQYPPTRKFQELSLVLKQFMSFSDLKQYYQFVIPDLQQYFERPQLELIEMDLYLSEYLGRFVQTSRCDNIDPEIEKLNEQFIINQEIKAIKLLQQLFQNNNLTLNLQKAQQTFIDSENKITSRQILYVVNNEIQVQILFAKQKFFMNQPLQLQIESKSVTDAQGITRTQSPKLKNHFKLTKQYYFQYTNKENQTINNSYKFVLDQMKNNHAICYIFNIEDEISPFVQNGYFQELCELFSVLICNCSQENVCCIFFDKQMYSQFYSQIKLDQIEKELTEHKCCSHTCKNCGLKKDGVTVEQNPVKQHKLAMQIIKNYEKQKQAEEQQIQQSDDE